jgi:hypothetical protein
MNLIFRTGRITGKRRNSMRWKATLDVSDVWGKYKKPRLSKLEVMELSLVIYTRLRTLYREQFSGDPILHNIILGFWGLAEGLNDTHNRKRVFNGLWDQLYDWGDCHRLWIKTF